MTLLCNRCDRRPPCRLAFDGSTAHMHPGFLQREANGLEAVACRAQPVDFTGEGERLAVRAARRELGGEFHDRRLWRTQQVWAHPTLGAPMTCGDISSLGRLGTSCGSAWSGCGPLGRRIGAAFEVHLEGLCVTRYGFSPDVIRNRSGRGPSTRHSTCQRGPDSMVFGANSSALMRRYHPILNA
jgi:hypothetical protein